MTQNIIHTELNDMKIAYLCWWTLSSKYRLLDLLLYSSNCKILNFQLLAVFRYSLLVLKIY